MRVGAWPLCRTVRAPGRDAWGRRERLDCVVSALRFTGAAMGGSRSGNSAMTVSTAPHGVDYYLLDADGSPILTPTSTWSSQIPEYVHHHSPDPGGLITVLVVAGMGAELAAPAEPDCADLSDERDFAAADIAWRADTLGVAGISLHKLRGGSCSGGPHWWITPSADRRSRCGTRCWATTVLARCSTASSADSSCCSSTRQMLAASGFTLGYARASARESTSVG